jgi:hypothetical protein
MLEDNKIDDYNLLRNRLKKFISNYYFHQWLKGGLQFLIVIVTIYLLTTTLEYNLYLSPDIRRVLFFLFLVAFLLLFYFWVLSPLLEFIQNRTRINDKQAAKIIGKHFPEVKDKLINLLYLDEMRDKNKSLELIQASIRQKSQSLLWVKFTDAIDWAKNRKLAKYLLIPISIFLALLFWIPNLFKESTHRLINYNQVFSPKAPFSFVILNSSLKVAQFESINIKAKLEGKSLPEDLNILYQGVKYPMVASGNGVYDFTLKNVVNNANFRLESLDFLSEEYMLDIVPRPLITSFDIEVIPPNYTGVKRFTIPNSGDIQTPEGSTAIWKFKTENVDNIQLHLGDQKLSVESFSNGFGAKACLRQSTSYAVLIRNNRSSLIDSQRYEIRLVKDDHPMISLREFNDTIHEIKYYAGDVSDDYGISALYFIIQYQDKFEKLKVNIPTGKNPSFYFSTQKLFNNYPKGAELNYYFEVYDNDQVNGPKSTRSAMFYQRKLSEKELEKVVYNNAAQIQNELAKSLKDAKQFQADLEQLKKKMLEKNQMDFNDKKLIENFRKNSRIAKRISKEILIKKMNSVNKSSQCSISSSS